MFLLPKSFERTSHITVNAKADAKPLNDPDITKKTIFPISSNEYNGFLFLMKRSAKDVTNNPADNCVGSVQKPVKVNIPILFTLPPIIEVALNTNNCRD